MSKTSLYIAVFLCILFSILFIIFPQIDIKTSSSFYYQGSFVKQEWMDMARNILDWITYFLVAFLILIFIWSILHKKYSLLKASFFLVLCFALGPGLLVNVTLKNNWGRPRPTAITQFGGNQTYQKPWVISQQCKTNCSFPAGEPSTAFTFFAFVFLFRKKIGRRLMITLFALNWLLFSYIRIAQGGHFLSDVLIGATLIYILIWLCYYLILSDFSQKL
jgi:lipid A 4'-phosphatase